VCEAGCWCGVGVAGVSVVRGPTYVDQTYCPLKRTLSIQTKLGNNDQWLGTRGGVKGVAVKGH